ncbi:MAG: DUF1285 domain-containing protein [Aestuariivita sp.]|nr:DUF1285 domain-containing protein [Aestuariivita sp.]MCY4345187.1 DUF1285 domain-containing protein [Aestuariivita sp.]
MAKVQPKHESVTSSPEGLIARAKSATKGGVAPVHLWNPPFCGDIDMRIARNGIWYYMGTPIGRPELVRLFSSILKREADRYYLVTPVEKVGIVVDDAPFLAVDFNVSYAGKDQLLTFETQVGDFACAGPDFPLRIEFDAETAEPSPYILIRSNLEALIDRKSFHRLIDLAVHHADWFGVWSGGTFFRFMPSQEIREIEENRSDFV